jgi:pilus assembly protein CpaC
MSTGTKQRFIAVLTIACAILAVTFAGDAAAQNPKIRVSVGQSVTHDVLSPISTVSIANSEVADVVVANPYQLLINGKDVGFTTLVVWDEDNRSTLYDVVVRNPFSDQQIELRVKVAEVNRTRALELGFDWFFQSDRWTGAVFSGEGVGASPSLPLQIFDPAVGFADGANLVGRYAFGGYDIQSMIKAMQTDGAIKLLAEPNVVASSGQPAKFLSGGEIPVPISSAGLTGGATVTIEWKEFGVKIDFLPTIVDEGVMSLAVAPEVSNLDYNNGIVTGGLVIPAIRTRRAETTVELRDGEVLVIGGLLLEEETKIKQRIPILGHIPLLGELFSSTSNQTTTSELLLVISPQLIRALPPGSEVPLPGQPAPEEEASDGSGEE